MSARVTGTTYKTVDGKKFKVLDVQHFSHDEIGVANRSYLNTLREGMLVSVWIRSPVPLITVNDGVVRLKGIEYLGRLVAGSGEICKTLGITKTRHPTPLQKV